MTNGTAPDLAQHMDRVARALLGEPNRRLSKQHELRYGTNGSLKVDLASGTYYDHEAKTGGGVLDFIKYKKGLTTNADAFDFMRQIGCDVGDVGGNGAAKPDARKLVATFDYRDAGGKLVSQAVRYEYEHAQADEPKKTFRQRRPDGNGGWIWNVEGVPVLPYRLPQLLEAVAGGLTIFIVEGEGKVEALAKWNIPATCNAGGSGKWKQEHSNYLRDVDVVILPDNDGPGRTHANVVGAALAGIAASVRLLELPGLGAKGDVIDWIKAGGTVEQFWQLAEQARPWAPYSDDDKQKQDEPPPASGWKFHEATAPSATRWLVKGILPETGAALVAGQWGAYKTTTALDLSVSVMTGQPFAERYQVKRKGGVLFIALEGEGMVANHLTAIAQHHGITGRLPFAWRGTCPPLTDKNAADILCRYATEAAANLERQFNLPVALVWIDTLVSAAGYNSGEDSDTAAAQKVMNTLRTTSQRTGALVVAIDHFGKVMETGTRGSSAKEGAADTVIAMLAERELSGGVKNTRLAVRKQRDGVSGFEIPFTARIVETGADDDGDPITAPIIHWQPTRDSARQVDARWTPSMQLLRRVLGTIIADSGQDVRPFTDGPLVHACNVELVRAEFYRQYPADGTDTQKAETRRKAFNRSLKASQVEGLIATREVDGVQLVWLTKPDEAKQ